MNLYDNRFIINRKCTAWVWAISYIWPFSRQVVLPLCLLQVLASEAGFNFMKVTSADVVSSDSCGLLNFISPLLCVWIQVWIVATVQRNNQWSLSLLCDLLLQTSQWYGQGEKLIKCVFEVAYEAARDETVEEKQRACVIFIDEVSTFAFVFTLKLWTVVLHLHMFYECMYIGIDGHMHAVNLFCM